MAGEPNVSVVGFLVMVRLSSLVSSPALGWSMAKGASTGSSRLQCRGAYVRIVRRTWGVIILASSPVDEQARQSGRPRSHVSGGRCGARRLASKAAKKRSSGQALSTAGHALERPIIPPRGARGDGDRTPPRGPGEPPPPPPVPRAGKARQGSALHGPRRRGVRPTTRQPRKPRRWQGGSGVHKRTQERSPASGGRRRLPVAVYHRHHHSGGWRSGQVRRGVCEIG
ncbi:hypothetical protein U9M48_004249 [Paspalum notatum var. saurae]|uniref:Secreted protein n=1 Tax=Paspalum notatum var. saurae TaxID=547442 RepID=A0AAQ3SHK1_PASNO